jgi:hypothetical protein
MANDEHVALLKEGVDAWNAWRQANPDIRPDLSGADLGEANLTNVNLSGAYLLGTDLRGVVLNQANFFEADLSEADLRGARLFAAQFFKVRLTRANLSGADLLWANLFGANLTRASFFGANLLGANLSEANLSRANLRGTALVDADLTDADLTGSLIYGVSAWGLKLERTKQQNLIITPADEPAITVDDIEVAQFIYLMLNNQKVRDVIDTITSKAVLILGRFTDERKAVLDALREELRERDYLPCLTLMFRPPATLPRPSRCPAWPASSLPT